MSVGRLEQKCFQLATKSIGRPIIFVASWKYFCSSLPTDTMIQTRDCSEKALLSPICWRVLGTTRSPVDEAHRPDQCDSGCCLFAVKISSSHIHTRFTALFPGLPGWASTRKVKAILILLKQETVSGSGVSWAICKSVPSSRQITTPAPHHSVFYRLDAHPATQPCLHSASRDVSTVLLGRWHCGNVSYGRSLGVVYGWGLVCLHHCIQISQSSRWLEYVCL